MRRAAGVAVALCALAGCGDGEAEEASTPGFGHPPPVAKLGRGATTPAPVRCPPDAAHCRSASGPILYVERVDPDGDGDAHFVLLDRHGITAPGISVIDVARELRPHPLPGPGETLSAAGPVYPGSHGQLQIQATEVRAPRE